MATVTGETIFARARTEASQRGGDANSSAIIDSLGGIRAMLNGTIRSLYRSKASNQRFVWDITVKNTIAMAGGVGDVPETLMREMMPQANIEDEAGSLISYFNYAVDVTSGQTYDQLGYLWIVGNEFNYIAPAPDLGDYDGDLFVSCPSFPVLPAAMSSSITFPSTAIIDDLCSLLASNLRGEA